MAIRVCYVYILLAFVCYQIYFLTLIYFGYFFRVFSYYMFCSYIYVVPMIIFPISNLSYWYQLSFIQERCFTPIFSGRFFGMKGVYSRKYLTSLYLDIPRLTINSNLLVIISASHYFYYLPCT